MNGLLLLTIALAYFAAGYAFYGGYLNRLFGIDDRRSTPSETKNPGVSGTLFAIVPPGRPSDPDAGPSHLLHGAVLFQGLIKVQHALHRQKGLLADILGHLDIVSLRAFQSG